MLINGKFIKVHERNIYFSHITSMILYHYDREEYTNTVFVLGDYIDYPISYFRVLYPGMKIIAYQFEQLCGGSTWHSVERTIFNLRGFDEIWEYDAINVAYLRRYGIEPNRLAPVRYTPSLKFNHNEPLNIDVLFYGYMNHRRFRFISKLQTYGYGRLNFVHAYGIFGEDLDRLISRSKIILNIHAFEPYHRQEQPRIFYPLVNNKCILSEASQANWFGDSINEFTESTFIQLLDHGFVNQFCSTKFMDATLDDKAYAINVAKYQEKYLT